MEEQCRNNWTCVRQKRGKKRRGKEGEKKEGRKERERETCRVAMEKQTQRTDLWTEGEGVMYGENNMETYIMICKIDS